MEALNISAVTCRKPCGKKLISQSTQSSQPAEAKPAASTHWKLDPSPTPEEPATSHAQSIIFTLQSLQPVTAGNFPSLINATYTSCWHHSWHRSSSSVCTGSHLQPQSQGASCCPMLQALIHSQQRQLAASSPGAGPGT